MVCVYTGKGGQKREKEGATQRQECQSANVYVMILRAIAENSI